MTNLIPCPFCGSSDDLHEFDEWGLCGDCGARGPISVNGAAGELWNTRARDPALDELEEWLVEWLQHSPYRKVGAIASALAKLRELRGES